MDVAGLAQGLAHGEPLSGAAISALTRAVRGKLGLLMPGPEFCHLRGFGSPRSF